VTLETSMGHQGRPLAQLVERHRAEILAYLTRLLGNSNDAEDACQDALLRACQAFDAGTVNANARAWLFKIATRSAFTLWRRRTRSRGRVADVDVEALPSSAASFDHRVELQRVIRAVQTLPPKQRAALMQRQFHDLGYEDIGASLGCGATAARANVYQAIKRLRQMIGDENVRPERRPAATGVRRAAALREKTR